MLPSGVHERRAHLRIGLIFGATISKPGWFHVEGATENISQGGTLVRTEDWHAFQVNDPLCVNMNETPSPW
jgi:hypothetical protein